MKMRMQFKRHAMGNGLHSLWMQFNVMPSTKALLSLQLVFTQVCRPEGVKDN